MKFLFTSRPDMEQDCTFEENATSPKTDTCSCSDSSAKSPKTTQNHNLFFPAFVLQSWMKVSSEGEPGVGPVRVWLPLFAPKFVTSKIFAPACKRHKFVLVFPRQTFQYISSYPHPKTGEGVSGPPPKQSLDLL